MKTRITSRVLTQPLQNLDPISFEPPEQLSLRNGRWFTLTKVLKIRSEISARNFAKKNFKNFWKINTYNDKSCFLM